MQVIGGQEKVIAYAIRMPRKPERCYCATQRELLALVWAVEYFQQIYLFGLRFQAKTDHHALQWLTNVIGKDYSCMFDEGYTEKNCDKGK